MELNYELTGYLLRIEKYPKVERHILKCARYFGLGVIVFIDIIILIIYNIGSILSSPVIELSWRYYVFRDVVLNLFLLGIILWISIAQFYPVVKAACESGIIKGFQQRIQWDNPCTILFGNDSFTIIFEEVGKKGEEIDYKDSEWIKAQDNIICISHNIIVNNVSKDVIDILRSKLRL